MQSRLEKLTITVVESTRTKYIAIGDGEIEAELAEFVEFNSASIQNAINKALKSYKEKIEQTEAKKGVEVETFYAE